MRTTAPSEELDCPGGARRPLSCDRIVGAAVAFVEANCLAQLSMRRLGSELGVEAMSLYRYFPSKALLVDAVVCRVLGGLELPAETATDWEPAVRAYARSYRALARQHPDLLPLLAADGGARATATEVEQRMQALWRRAGLTGDGPRRAQRAVQAYVIGSCLQAPAARSEDVEADFELGLEALLSGLRTRLPLSS